MLGSCLVSWSGCWNLSLGAGGALIGNWMVELTWKLAGEGSLLDRELLQELDINRELVEPISWLFNPGWVGGYERRTGDG